MKTKEILKEWRSFLKEEKELSDKSPEWILKQGEGGKAIYKGKEVEIIKPDIRGPQVLIKKEDGEEESVSYDELSEP